MRARLAGLPAWTLTAACSAVYLIAAPSPPDLAAAAYRSDVFARAGFTVWDNSWYGGHHMLAYSLLSPALGALLGPRLLTALSMTALAALFEVFIAGLFPARAARVAALWLALGAAIGLLSSRVAFDLGLAIGVGALIAGRRSHMWAALGLTIACSVASPVAGAFLAMAWLAWGLAGPRRGWPGALTVCASAPIGALAIAFPEGGSQPFVGSAFWPALAGVIVVGALLPSEQRVLRIGCVLYSLALTASFIVPTAVGGNADRLGALFAGPIAACVLTVAPPRRVRALIALSPLLLYWQANAPVADFASTVGNPSLGASYYAPLLAELRSLGVGYGLRPARLEAVPTSDHWESRWLAPHIMLARGWERQLDRYRDGIFYDESSPLSASAYGSWLQRNAVSYVALPDAPIDYSSTSEARLLSGRSGPLPAYLTEIWHSRHWRLFAVSGASQLAQAPARLISAGVDSMTIAAPAAGTYLVRIHFTPYWKADQAGACVSDAPGNWTFVHTPRAGSVHIVIDLTITRIFDHSERCS